MDCSKTIDFFHELKRLCDSRDRCIADTANKERCPMVGLCARALIKIRVEDAARLVEIIQKWSDEYPKKTYAQDFFEKFPDAQSYSDGSPVICRQIIYGGIRPPLESCYYTGACYKCWNEPLNDEQTPKGDNER